MKKLSTFTLFLTLFVSAYAQIELENPSFEDAPKDATTPTYWAACGKYTTPDILPGYNDYNQLIWDVDHQPTDGETFVGLIAREDNTREYIGQKLSKPLEADVCYSFSLDLAKSRYYAGYNETLVLKIWLSNEQCKRKELIEYIVVDNEEWINHKVILMASDTYRYIIFEVYYEDKLNSSEPKSPYRGNVLIDNISTIQKCE